MKDHNMHIVLLIGHFAKVCMLSLLSDTFQIAYACFAAAAKTKQKAHIWL